MQLATDHPYLLLIRGLPGSGKSYLATALQDTIGVDRVLLLDPDAIDYGSDAYKALVEKLTAEGLEEKFFPHRYLRGLATEAIDANKVIIWNQAFTDLGGFGRTASFLQDYAVEHEVALPLLVIEMNIDEETAKSRVAERAANGAHDVSPENFERFIRDYRSFADEGYDTISISGNGDIAAMTQAVLQELSGL